MNKNDQTRQLLTVTRQVKTNVSLTDILFVDKASKMFKNEKCIQLFTNDAALLYLLKKPSCTRFYKIFIRD